MTIASGVPRGDSKHKRLKIGALYLRKTQLQPKGQKKNLNSNPRMTRLGLKKRNRTPTTQRKLGSISRNSLKLQLITLPLAGQNLLSNAAWGF